MPMRGPFDLLQSLDWHPHLMPSMQMYDAIRMHQVLIAK
ncbi:Integrase family protein [Yersinia intermedia ATCC 29909]|nr:Integrase family protein [Yersinia intermedia ATCC 29909]